MKCHRVEVPAEGISVWYDNLACPRDDSFIHGGRVKTLLLNQEFPEHKDRCNILYLVSSSLPENAGDLIAWAKRKGIRVVWNQNGVAYPAWAGGGYAETNRLLAGLLHQSDYVVYQSEFCRESSHRYLGAPRQRSSIIYNCVDTEIFRPGSQHRADDNWMILAAGSHQQKERVFSVLEAFARIKQRRRGARLVLAGKCDWGGGESQTMEMIRALGIEPDVTRVKAYNQEQAPDLYRQADVLLHPKYKDPCPTVVIEAMACGVPVVGSRSGGMPELVGEDGGVLVDVPDSWDRMYYPAPEQVASAVDVVMRNREELGRTARTRVLNKFSKPVFTESHRKVFEKMTVTGAAR